jgi:hypothetical protein
LVTPILRHGGTTTVARRLTATINADGGLIDFKSAMTSGDGAGLLAVGAGKLEFDAAVAEDRFLVLSARSSMDFESRLGVALTRSPSGP